MTENDNAVDQNELDPIDVNALSEHYAEAATEGGSQKPRPGAYNLRMPSELPDASFSPVKRTQDGRSYLRIKLDNGKRGDEGEGLAIVDGPFAGAQARFITITTLQQKVTKWNKATRTSEPVLAPDGSPKVFIDAFDLLKRFDPAAQLPQSRQAWIDALRALEGKTIPGTVYLDWQAELPGSKNDRGYNRKLYASNFRSGKGKDATYVPYLDVVAENAFTQKKKGVETEVLPGEAYRVFPNLVLGRQALSPRK